jgi:predicted nuclease of predicted toxin-antitoxin system
MEWREVRIRRRYRSKSFGQRYLTYATGRGLVIVSKDADFADRVLLSTSGPSVIHLKVGNMKFRELDEFLARVWEDICALNAQYRLVQVFIDRIEAIG